jgi:hypothetical protein
MPSASSTASSINSRIRSAAIHARSPESTEPKWTIGRKESQKSQKGRLGFVRLLPPRGQSQLRWVDLTKQNHFRRESSSCLGFQGYKRQGNGVDHS